MRKTIWVTAVTRCGMVVHAMAHKRKRQAVCGAAVYLKTEGYSGPGTLPDICDWLAQQDDHIGVDIFPASLNTADSDSCSCGLPDNAKAQKGLIIDPPPQEQGPEPLYRAVYTIDVNAQNAHQAAERAYDIMVDPESMRPVLEVIDSRGRLTRIDLCEERAEDHE